MKHFILFILLFSFSNSSIAQDYYPPQRVGISDADYNKYIKELKFHYQSPRRDATMNIAIFYAHLGEKEEVVFDQIEKGMKENLKVACSMIGLKLHQAKRLNLTIPYEKINKKRWDDICNYCDSIQKVNEKKQALETNNNPLFNHDLIKKLKELEHNDQKVRLMILVHNSPEYKKQWAIQRKLDAINQAEIRKIIKKYGYPGASLVGKNNAYIAAIIIQHAPLEMQEEFFPILSEAQQKGEISGGLLHLLLDRIHTKKYGKQVFGSQQIWDKKLKKMVSVPLYSKEEIIEIKKKYNIQ